MDVVLQVRDLRKTFEAEGASVRALRGVDLAIGRGECVAVMGPSGCGKSTLLHVIAGLDTPTEGEVVLAGLSLAGKDEDELARIRREHVGIVFQFFNLLEGMSALENVTLPAVIAGTPRRQAETRARDLLDLPGLVEKAEDAPGVLSGGQRQRLAIARAMLKDAPILLLDEATSALDSETERQVQAALRSLMRGRTTVVIAHRLSTIIGADLICVMDQGHIVETGRHAQLLAKSGLYARLYETQFAAERERAPEAAAAGEAGS